MFVGKRADDPFKQITGIAHDRRGLLRPGRKSTTTFPWERETMINGELRITLKDVLDESEVRTLIHHRVDKLKALCPWMTRCVVSVDVPHRHHRRGKHYHVRIDMTVPGAELVVGRDRARSIRAEAVLPAVRDAFHAAERQLQEYEAKIKPHAKPSLTHRMGGSFGPPPLQAARE